MASGNAILAGLLGGFGNAASGIGNAFAVQQKEQLERERLEQERDLRQQAIDAQLQQIKQAGPIDYGALPAPLRAIVDPTGTGGSLDPRLIPMVQKQAELIQARAMGGQAANALEAQFPPNDIQGPTRSGEPIGLQPTMPANISLLLPMLRAGMVEKPAEVLSQAIQKPELKEIQDEQGRTYLVPFNPATGQPVPGAQRTLKSMGPQDVMNWLNNGGQSPSSGGAPKIQFVPSIGKEGVTFRGDAEPPNYQYVRGMLADAGWQPGMPGYDTEFATQLQQPVPIAAGGKATSRSEGIRPPSFYANAATPGATGAPAGPQPPGRATSAPRWQGDPAAVSDATTKDVMTALQMRDAVNQIGQALKDPIVAQSYIGPYDQYRDWFQGKAPMEMGGKIPSSVVQLDANLHALQNYTVRLITGAQMNKDETPRIMGQLPQRGNQIDEFRQRMKMSMDNVSMMEDRIRTLALQGDQNAKLEMRELGLDKFQERRVPPPGGPPPPKLPAGARMDGGEVVSESGQYVWRNGQWQTR